MSRRSRTHSKPIPPPSTRPDVVPPVAPSSPPRPTSRQKLLLAGAISLEILWLALLLILACLGIKS
ncbi:MAG: hypothetical protein JXB10_08650 [Pirellulales bacterium]|nr:hypothetical protein [Pirellulales bacterium]